MMTSTICLFKREMKSFLVSPLSYLMMAIFSFVMGLLFFNYLVLSKEIPSEVITRQVLRPVFGNMNFLLMLLCPLITMKQFAGERALHISELWETAPVTHFSLWMGKFLASFLTTLIIISPTLILPIVLSFAGYSEWPVVLTSYLGLSLNIALFLAVGLFGSSLTNNQLVAALCSFCLLFALLIFIVSANATENLLLAEIFQYLSSAFHYEGFARGVVKSFDLVYYISAVGLMAYLTQISLRARSW